MLFRDIHRQLTCYRHIFCDLAVPNRCAYPFRHNLKKSATTVFSYPDSLPQGAPRAPNVALVRTFNTLRFHRADEDGAQMSSRLCSSAYLTQEGQDPCQT
jgi:hypothetical protein